MLGILLDATVIVALVYLVNQGEQMDFGPAAICGLGISLGSYAIAIALGPVLGIFVLGPITMLAIALIWMIAKIPSNQAAIAGVLFMVYKIAMIFALAAMFGGAAE